MLVGMQFSSKVLSQSFFIHDVPIPFRASPNLLKYLSKIIFGVSAPNGDVDFGRVLTDIGKGLS